MRLHTAWATLLLVGAAVSVAQEAPDWRAKVDRWVHDEVEKAGSAEFLVFMGDQADLSGADRLPTKAARNRYVFERLSRTAERAQVELLVRLRRAGVEHRPFWIANMILVEGDGELLAELARRSDVARIHANPRVELDRPQREAIAMRGVSTVAVEASLRHTLAPDVFWARGIDGAGVVIGGQDTGYEWTHPALRPSYRGAAGGAVDHNYHWHDSIHSGGGSCGPDSPEPCDDDDHGTHTMGTMVGDDGGGNQIGMAPGATWIGCRNMDQGVGTPASYSECFQWFVAPTDLDGRNPDPAMAPDVINNSWSCPPREGCEDPGALLAVVRNTRQAGILVVTSAGNEGPDCETIASPTAIYDEVLTVGATNNADGATSFTSRGPVTVDGSGRLKPDVVAPGFQIRSSVRGDRYGSLNGTSMAAPHVSGLAALLISSGSCMHNVDALEEHIVGTVEPQVADQFCGVPGSEIPNGVYGAGAIRAVMPACGDGVAGRLTGMTAQKVICRNRSSKPKQKVSSRLGGADVWDCSAAGLDSAAGDRLKIQLTATADGGGEAAGEIDGVKKPKVVCRNRTSGGKRTVKPGAGEPWDCAAAGLDVGDGDSLKITISGKAD